ncbi:thiamine biosynthetic bifunctional enzyme [Trichomonascus vanleenenianus]|uniref:bifunctional hydroxyethylthiazole kinase/thiamine-phosphate diphosphorylase n=1 Tax=Trichomonascus vanleenenianus TaxID=2268995 RepID=UPI003ECB0D5E
MADVDYSIYLVTDTPLVPAGLTLEQQVQKSIENGATIVQLREKTAETRDFVEIAKRIHKITKQAGIPLIINDRLDVALAIDAEGVHVGQDDMDVPTIRKFLPGKIVGVSVNNVEEARQAIKDRVEYVGIGAVFGTLTKDLKKAPIGCSGVRDILKVLQEECDYDMKTVAIGGINASNVQQVMELSAAEKKRLDGVAVVSGIIAAQDAGAATKELKALFGSPGPWTRVPGAGVSSVDVLLKLAPKLVSKVAEVSPLLHHITNNVVKNISANMSIAAGASPAMSECAEEFPDFAAVPNAGLLINMGTVSTVSIDMYQAALKAYNSNGRAVVLDPVGCGASGQRRRVVSILLNSGIYDVIKGNEGEITAAAKVKGAAMKGVDSVGVSTLEKRIETTRKLAVENHTTVLMTGSQDVLVEGIGSGRTLVFENGDPYLGKITGSGCILGSLITAFTAVESNDRVAAAASALLLYTLASERAVQRPEVKGPGTFVPALLDCVHEISLESQAGNTEWINAAKVKFV